MKHISNYTAKNIVFLFQPKYFIVCQSNISFHDKEGLYFTTSTVVDWIDIFTRPDYKTFIIDSLKYNQQQKGLVIHSWCLMTNHLHMIVSAQEGFNLSAIMRDFKKFTSKEIIRKQ